ncbi:MAG: hypothetical protein GF364_09905 [Candidatus Lokiarchaeota archaeon]|nr:hypothetical protein [Candidatus Lokiarchaeota archaeon]
MITGIIICGLVIIKFSEKKNRTLIAIFTLICVIIFGTFTTEIIIIQLFALLCVLLLTLYSAFAIIYPRLFIEKEEQFFQPRHEQIWAKKDKNKGK